MNQHFRQEVELITKLGIIDHSEMYVSSVK